MGVDNSGIPPQGPGSASYPGRQGSRRRERFQDHRNDRSWRDEPILAVAREPAKIRGKRLRQTREDLVFPADPATNLTRHFKLPFSRSQSFRVPDVHNPCAAIGEANEEVRNMPPRALGVLWPQQGEWLRSNPNNIQVMISGHQEFPFQQTLEPHMGTHRAGPPRAFVIPLARPRKE